MGKSNIEDVFKRIIEPNMSVIQETAKQFGIPMFATFQTTPTKFRTYSVNENKSNWPKIKHMLALDETWSLDEFMEKIIEDALRNGHDSAFLSALGIPKKKQ